VSATAIKERPILMSAPMVRAILDGRKTQTRRIAKDVTEWHTEENPLDKCVVRDGVAYCDAQVRVDDVLTFEFKCPYGQPGDRLWVRETFAVTNSAPYADGQSDEIAFYKASWDESEQPKWKPSIFMPRKVSRITLEITEVRVERLQDISEEDAMAEGFGLGAVIKAERFGRYMSAGQYAFASLWEKINGKESWRTNPWVWAISFRRVES
jgi:hypothetical protein